MDFVREHDAVVKEISVSPGKRLSLQSHNKRQEYWIVFQGSGSAIVGDKNIELSCADVAFDVEYNAGDTLYVVNNGDVPVRDFKVQVKNSGTKTTFNFNREGVIFEGITSGNGATVGVSDEGVGTAEEVVVIPILSGRNDAGTEKDYVCDEKYGMKIYPAG